jgi:drug/metabolite transporter (DMT)-like permease
LALVAAVCQAAGSLLSKAGIGHGWLPEAEHLGPQAATLLRMFFAALTVWPTLLWLGRRESPRALRERRGGESGDESAAVHKRTYAPWSGYAFTFCGAIVGPYLGVWMSLVAFDHTSLGVAQTLCSLPPVFVLPIMIWVYREPVSRRAVLGALLAVAGLPLLFVAG